MIDKSTYNHLDIRAEVLIAELLERKSNLTLEDLAIHPNGKFNHTIGRDIRSIIKEENQFGEEKIKVLVSRPGLYDTLPQGLFHKLDFNDNRNGFSSKEIVLDGIKKMNQEEKEARKYFAPFDQLFNRYRVLIEQEERQMLTGFPLDSSHTLFDIIWGNFAVSMSNYQKTILFTLLPMAHHIIGNLEYTRKAFEMVIGYPISINKNFVKVDISSFTSNSLGSMLLSENFVLGDTSTEIVERYDIHVGPLPSEASENYLPNGEATKVLELLANYLLPLEMDTQFSFSIESNPIEFTNDKSTTTLGENRLGYSIHI